MHQTHAAPVIGQAIGQTLRGPFDLVAAALRGHAEAFRLHRFSGSEEDRL